MSEETNEEREQFVEDCKAYDRCLGMMSVGISNRIMVSVFMTYIVSICLTEKRPAAALNEVITLLQKSYNEAVEHENNK